MAYNTDRIATFILGMTKELNMVMAEKLDSVMADGEFPSSDVCERRSSDEFD